MDDALNGDDLLAVPFGSDLCLVRATFPQTYDISVLPCARVWIISTSMSCLVRLVAMAIVWVWIQFYV